VSKTSQTERNPVWDEVVKIIEARKTKTPGAFEFTGLPEGITQQEIEDRLRLHGELALCKCGKFMYRVHSGWRCLCGNYQKKEGAKSET